jgi:DNA modification methylase
LKPYYEHGGITIYHGDCREILPSIARESVCITDPPYGVGETYASFRDTPSSLRLLVDSTWHHIAACKRVALTPGVKYHRLWPEPTWTLSWVTPAGTGCGPWGFCTWQPILVYGDDPYLSAGKGSRPDSLVQTESSEKNGHPCPKPIGVWTWVVQRVSLPGEPIVDPFLGSGTTLEVAKLLGRRAIGIEIEERYCEIAAKRLQQEVLPLEQLA